MAKKIAKKAVSPVLATLMMAAVAVALSVIIFTWSQGFLSQTGEASSAQQAQQNIAAQSGIAIDGVTFDTTSGTATVYVRNVGTVTITPAMVIATNLSTGEQTTQSTFSPSSLNPGGGASATVTFSSSGLTSGNIVSFRVTTTKGTFAQATYVVP
jgi:FlaG/FlaF family flagellin (archaellin)